MSADGGIAAAELGPDSAGSRAQLARLTLKGRKAQDKYRQLLNLVEEHWRARFGGEKTRRL